MNYWCDTCGGLVDRIGLQPTDVRFCGCAAKITRLAAELAEARAEIERLRAGYSKAIEDIAEWAAYADVYFQEKWDSEGCIAKHKAILTEVDHG